MNIDWLEISRQLLAFILGLISGGLFTYLRDRLDKRKLKSELLLELTYRLFPGNDENQIKNEIEFQKKFDSPQNLLTLRVTNNGQTTVTIIDGGFSKNSVTTRGPDWELPKTLLESELVEYKYNIHLKDLFKYKYGWVETSLKESFKIPIDRDNLPFTFFLGEISLDLDIE